VTVALTIRRATPADCRQLWLWVNDPSARAASFDTADVPWPDHVAWFEARLASPNTRIYIAEADDGAPVGQVRFDLDAAGAAEVDVCLDAEWRGRRLAADLLRMAAAAFLLEGPSLLVAHVRPENLASQRAFERAGFLKVGPEAVNGHRSVRYERRPHDQGA
jgi:RimJ/RimL family protein N-acetyltransferase